MILIEIKLIKSSTKYLFLTSQGYIQWMQLLWTLVRNTQRMSEWSARHRDINANKRNGNRFEQYLYLIISVNCKKIKSK